MSTRQFSRKLSLQIDRAIIGMEAAPVMWRWIWRAWFNWLTRDIP